jgi:hypothetical protein
MHSIFSPAPWHMNVCARGEAGVASVKLPPRSPNLNAHAERFVRTIKESWLERMILFGERAVRKRVQEKLVCSVGETRLSGIIGGRGKRGYGGIMNPPCRPKGQGWKPSTYSWRARAPLYPDRIKHEKIFVAANRFSLFVNGIVVRKHFGLRTGVRSIDYGS